MIEEISSEQKKARTFLFIWTSLYLIGFPFVFWMSLWSILIFDSPSIATSLGLVIIFAFLCIPFSMLVSIWKMWSKYIKGDYSKMRFFCSLPLFNLGFAILLNTIIQTLLRR